MYFNTMNLKVREKIQEDFDKLWDYYVTVNGPWNPETSEGNQYLADNNVRCAIGTLMDYNLLKDLLTESPVLNVSRISAFVSRLDKSDENIVNDLLGIKFNDVKDRKEYIHFLTDVQELHDDITGRIPYESIYVGFYDLMELGLEDLAEIWDLKIPQT